MKINFPYLKFSSFYFFYFSSLGAFLPFWPLYLNEKGYSAYQIGFILAIMIGTKIIAPNVWGWISAISGLRHKVIQLGSFFCFLIFSMVFLIDGFYQMAVLILLFSFFWNASLPQFEAVTMSMLGEGHNSYSKIRLWGSLGFIVSVMILSIITEKYGMGVVPQAITLFLFITWLSTLFITNIDPNNKSNRKENMLTVLRNPIIIGILLSCFLMQLSHGPFYTFFAIYLDENDYSMSTIGFLWSLGVLAEVIIFLKVSEWIPKYGTKTLFNLCFIFASIRWVIVAIFPANIFLIGLSQIFHAVTYGMYHAVSISLIHRYFTGYLQGRGQALYSSISFGLGGSFGSFLCGYFWDILGGQIIYLFASLFAFFGFLVSFILVKLNKGQNG